MVAEHQPGCPLDAATGPVGVVCEHGYDVCPQCDPCTCEVKSDLRGRCPVVWFKTMEGDCPLCRRPKEVHFSPAVYALPEVT